MDVTNPTDPEAASARLKELHDTQDLFDDAVRKGDILAALEAAQRYREGLQWLSDHKIPVSTDERLRPRLFGEEDTVKVAISQGYVQDASNEDIQGLLNKHLFNQEGRPYPYTLSQILDKMATYDHITQQKFAQIYRVMLLPPKIKLSKTMETHTLLFGLSPRRLAIAALMAINVIDTTGRIVEFQEV